RRCAWAAEMPSPSRSNASADRVPQDAGALVMTVPAGRSLLPADRVPWHPVARLGAFLVSVVVASLVAQAVAYPIVAFLLERLGVRPLLGSWLQLAGAWGGSVLAIRVAESSRALVPDRVALAREAWRLRALRDGALSGAMPMAAALAVLLFVGAYAVAPIADAGHGTAALRALAVLVPAAAAEEVLVRGYAFTVLAEWRGAALATGVTSVAFAALHAANPGATPGSLVNVALAGVLLALVRWRTGSLAAAIVAHLAWNTSLVVVAHAPVSGLAFATPGWRLVPQGPVWLTGGAWGPEGSLVATVTLGLACLLVARRAVSSVPSSARSGAPRVA
ncbi:MAG: CPBP family intramembrane metalloprotease, partial [Gemmatimonadaceae bacterium]|nr:CPBP family intramembrane metalloprotease [Gemmatimonadaceae bacterium]